MAWFFPARCAAATVRSPHRRKQRNSSRDPGANRAGAAHACARIHPPVLLSWMRMVSRFSILRGAFPEKELRRFATKLRNRSAHYHALAGMDELRLPESPGSRRPWDTSPGMLAAGTLDLPRSVTVGGRQARPGNGGVDPGDGAAPCRGRPGRLQPANRRTSDRSAGGGKPTTLKPMCSIRPQARSACGIGRRARLGRKSRTSGKRGGAGQGKAPAHQFPPKPGGGAGGRGGGGGGGEAGGNRWKP